MQVIDTHNNDPLMHGSHSSLSSVCAFFLLYIDCLTTSWKLLLPSSVAKSCLASNNHTIYYILDLPCTTSGMIMSETHNTPCMSRISYNCGRKHLCNGWNSKQSPQSFAAKKHSKFAFKSPYTVTVKPPNKRHLSL